ncbi:MAG: endonuclease MutS2 [Clostridiales Family XIII bacterium]|jgi:DNA mismatch repair protein MutS2|nr:endonuclease MutS2 [Clostridiales Family XIII bacterium]
MPEKAEEIRQFRLLEYYKVLKMLAERAGSALAKSACLSLLPSTNAAHIGRMTQETDEAVSIILKKGSPVFSDNPDIDEAAAYAAKGGTISNRQLLNIAGLLGAVKRIKNFLSSDLPEDVSHVKSIADGLVLFPKIEDRIKTSIASDTEILDSASTALRSIRRNIELQNGRIRDSLSKYVTSSAYDDVMMDKVITIRNGRFVVPVKQEQAGKFPGIVHDRSKGGATLFIEPQQVVDMNNKLRELQIEEEREIERILSELSAEVGEAAGDIRTNQKLLAELDFIFAKASLSCDMRAARAEVSTDSAVEIIGGRNPIIDPDKVVPITVKFGEAEKILIITGPNTGGKTVTVKTVGLFIIMAQSGLHVPAASATLPIVENVFCDIGDEQSIEQSLSTFSSHMKNIVEIVGKADENSIVLLDELGAGTDPTEGAALAMSILEFLRRKNILVIATTHYTELKKYAIATKGAVNASMEFDVDTLSPTYRLHMGNPGRSNAFEISKKLGLQDAIIDDARGYLDTETVAFDDVMDSIERDRKAAKESFEEAARLAAEAQREEEEIGERLRKIEDKRDEILEKARAQAKETIEEASDYADLVRGEIKELLSEARKASGGEDAGDIMRRVSESRKLLRALDEEVDKRTSSNRKTVSRPKQTAKSKGAIKIGDRVKIEGTDTKGEVLTAPDEKGKLTIQAGSIKMNISASRLIKIDSLPENAASSGSKGKKWSHNKKARQGSGSYGNIVAAKMDHISPSIDLHGKQLDEAVLLVDKYLDDAVLAGLGEVLINHGHGEGILRSGIRRMLKGHNHVRSFRSGDFDEGGDGVTVVTLSRR